MFYGLIVNISGKYDGIPADRIMEYQVKEINGISNKSLKNIRNRPTVIPGISGIKAICSNFD